MFLIMIHFDIWDWEETRIPLSTSLSRWFPSVLRNVDLHFEYLCRQLSVVLLQFLLALLQPHNESNFPIKETGSHGSHIQIRKVDWGISQQFEYPNIWLIYFPVEWIIDQKYQQMLEDRNLEETYFSPCESRNPCPKVRRRIWLKIHLEFICWV